jgi:hypothetical protein
MKDRHWFGKRRASLRAKRLREHLENIEVELLKRARQNWQEWEHVNAGRWSDVMQ